MISAWWLLTLLPVFFIGKTLGEMWGITRMRYLGERVRKLLAANNIERAIRLCKVAERITYTKQQPSFDAALNDLRDKDLKDE